MHFSGRPIIGTLERRSAECYEGRALDSAIKQQQRHEVAEWFLKHHRHHESMRILSLPDRFWSFENYINARGATSFCGLQRDWATLEHSVPWIPGSERVGIQSPRLKPRHFYFDIDTGTMQGYIREQNVLIYMWAGHFLSTRFQELTGKSTKRFWNRMCRDNTAIWLDFNGRLGEEIRVACDRLPVYVNMTRPRIPVIISFLAARDNFDNDDDRVAECIKWLSREHLTDVYREFRFKRVTKHQSADSPYLSVFGTFDLR